MMNYSWTIGHDSTLLKEQDLTVAIDIELVKTNPLSNDPFSIMKEMPDADNDGDYDIIRETGQPRASSECMNINGWINSNGILSKYRF